MLRHFITKALLYGAVLQALCAIGFAVPQSAIGAQKIQTVQRSLLPELLDRIVTITNLAEFRDREFGKTVEEIPELVRVAPLGEQSFEPIKNILLGAGLKAENELVLRTGLERCPESRLLRVYLAETLSGMGRSQEALNVLEEASRLRPTTGTDPATDRQQRALILLRMGSMHSAMSRLEDALRFYRQVVEAAPQWVEGRIHLGKAYFNVNRLEEAQAEFERAVLVAPDDKSAHLSLSEVYVARGQWERAAAAAERAIKLGTSDSRALYLAGTALVRMGRRTEGEARLREFAKVEAGSQEVERRYRDIDAISVAAIRMLQEGDGNGAVQRLIQGILTYPDSSRLYMNLALVMSRLNQHQKAVETLESMLQRTKERRFLIHKNLADEYAFLGATEASQRHRQIYLDTREAEFPGYTAR